MKKLLTTALMVLTLVGVMTVSASATETEVSSITDLNTNLAAGNDVILADTINGDVVVPSGVTVEIDLNGQTLTNSSSHTITVQNGGKLTVTDSSTTGKVYNIVDNYAALYVMVGGEATLLGGTFDRTEVKDTQSMSWYTIKNLGTLTIGETNGNDTKVKVVNSGNISSMITNGWYNSTDGYKAGYGESTPTLTIHSGTFDGGLNTIKNDDCGEVTINGGTFKNYVQAVIYNWNKATINGGNFTADDATYPILNGYCDASYDIGDFTINGGTFAGEKVYAQISGCSANSKLTIGGDFQVENGQIMTIGTGSTLTIAEGATLTNAGTLDISAGTLRNYGTVDNNGTMIVKGEAQLDQGIAAGGTVKLAEGFTAETPIIINGDVVIDGNGYTVDLVDKYTFGPSDADGAIVAIEDGFTLKNIIIKNAPQYGAIQNRNIENVNITLDDVTINYGTLDTNISGHAVYNFDGDVTAIDCTFISIAAAISNYAIYTCDKDSAVLITGCTFTFTVTSDTNMEAVCNDGGYTVYPQSEATLKAWIGTSWSRTPTAIVNNDITLADDFTIPAGKTLTIATDAELTIAAGKTLTIAEDATLSVSGTITSAADITIAEGGTLSISGTGAITFTGDAKLVQEGSDETVTVEASTSTTETKTTVSSAASVGTVPTDSKVSVDATTDSTTTTTTEVTIPAASVSNMKDAAEVTITTNNITVTFDSATVADFATTGDLVVTVAEKVVTDLEETQKAKVPDGAAIVDLSVTENGNAKTSFAGTVTVTIPYTHVDGKTPAVMYIDDDGAVTSMKVTDYTETTITFETTHFSYYASYSYTASSGGTSYYTSSVDSTDNGDVSISSAKSTSGSKITITTDPDNGYEVGDVTVTYSSGREVSVTDNGDGTYSYLQPGAAVTVSVTFVSEDGEEETEEEIVDEVDASGFSDVDADAYYYDAMLWAVENGITTGYSDGTFGPSITANRAQVVTFLWRAAGEPEATIDNPFTDLEADSYYYDAVLWAVENGITAGTTATTFAPNDTCNRGQIVTFLFRMDGETPVSGDEMPDVDADSYCYDSVMWAVANGITTGYTDGTFGANDLCNRGQIVTFLYRYLG